MTAPLRILVADDHSVVRAGLRALLDTVAEAELVGEAADGAEAIALAADLLPDVVLMDIGMPGVDGVEATRVITTQHPSVAVLVLTMYEDDETLFAALRAGARGYLLKGAGQGEVIRALEAVSTGNVILGPGAAERVLLAFDGDQRPPAPFPELTDREREVLSEVAAGRNNATIGHRLHLSPKTVANHVSNILSKLQLADRAEAIVAARRAGLGQDPPPGLPGSADPPG